jgi:hypothetical protein
VQANIKPTPENYCRNCGAKLERKRLPSGRLETLFHFTRRQFCDRSCMAKDFSSRKPPDRKVGWMASHRIARQNCPPGSCARCGRPDASDVHHKDGDWQNNTPANLERICRGCHVHEHRPRASCSVCGKPQKGLGYCDKHYQRFKKWGDPLMVKHNQHTPVQKMPD